MCRIVIKALFYSLLCFFVLCDADLKAAAATPEFTVETVARGLDTRWAIDFAPDNRIFVSERSDRIRMINRGQLQSEPWMTLDVAASAKPGSSVLRSILDLPETVSSMSPTLIAPAFLHFLRQYHALGQIDGRSSRNLMTTRSSDSILSPGEMRTDAEDDFEALVRRQEVRSICQKLAASSSFLF